jgi:uncharacterized protein YlxP (DUF503 family)
MAQSLKEKRSVVKSLLRKTQAKFTVSAAEVGDNELWQSAVLGIALTGNNQRLLEREKEKVLHFMEQDSAFEIVEIHHEIWSF